MPHEYFKTRNRLIFVHVHSKAQIKVPTPDGSVTMKIPAGVRSGQSLRLKGKGWSLPKGGRSDFIVKLQIVSPKDLSLIEREFYEKIRDNSTFDPRAGLDEVKV